MDGGGEAVNKSARDAVITGGTTLAVYNALIELGWGPAVSVVVAGLASFMVATLYRLIRKRWPWLAETDPA